MKRIGIMGGTFNPIHNGHLAVAQAAREQFTLEKVLFMPSGVPYMKNLQEVLPASVRCEMTALAISGIPYFEVSDMETVTEGNTYTCQTLTALKSLHPDTDYYFTLGADSLYAIEKWRNPEQIFRNCTILAAVRAYTTENSNGQNAGSQTGNAVDIRAQRRLQDQIRYLRENYQASIEMLKFSAMDISSTRIRDMLQRGASVDGLVPKEVADYIAENHLFRQ